MKDDESMAPPDGPKRWFEDPARLLQSVKETSQHWGQPLDIPGYERIVELRRGGQGVVYRARQRSTGRAVAIKVLLDGAYASQTSRLRFEQEIELAVRLRHPNIVPIYDSGVTPDGHLFYVMEYVHGRPLDDPDLDHVGDLRETLALFVRICDAVHYAHQHRVIHRDLKPSNILINQSGAPRILDFGLAKIAATPSPPGVAASSISGSGQFLGSLAWASPEQIEGSPEGVDIRTDVYSLGVILYQLIVGRLPYALSSNLRQTLNEITTAPPPRPLRPGLPDDVETIILRCLAKEPERRYQTVADLANDLRRFLTGDPIDAKRDKKWYVLRRTLARHKVMTYLILALFTGAVVFAATMTVLYRRAASAEQLARANLDRAEMQTAKIAAVRAFLENMLSSAEPAVSFDDSQTVRDMLNSAAHQIEDQFEGHPAVEAEIRSVMASAYRNLGLWKEAEEQERHALELRRALYGLEHAEVAESLLGLGRTLLHQRRFEEAEEDLEQALAMSRRQLGDDDAQVASCLLGLANLRHGQLRFPEAEEYYRRASGIFERRVGPDDDRTITALIQWSDLLVNTKRFDSAADKVETVLNRIRRRSGANDPLLSSALQSAALVKMYTGDFDAAMEALEEAADNHRALFGDRDPELAEIYNLMGDVRREQGSYADAESWHAKALAVCEQLGRRESPEGARCLWAMGQARWRAGDLDGAEELLTEAIDMRRRVYEPDHHLVTMGLFQLGKMQAEAGRHARALAPFEETVRNCRLVYGDAHALTIHATARLGACLAHLGRYGEGERVLKTAYAMFDETADKDDPRRIRLLHALVELYTLWNKPDAAAPYREQLPDASVGTAGKKSAWAPAPNPTRRLVRRRSGPENDGFSVRNGFNSRPPFLARGGGARATSHLKTPEGPGGHEVGPLGVGGCACNLAPARGNSNKGESQCRPGSFPLAT
jgi:tetratricopeptide (TPR) repeat protein/predicted Ser/Thr protein kinase